MRSKGATALEGQRGNALRVIALELERHRDDFEMRRRKRRAARFERRERICTIAARRGNRGERDKRGEADTRARHSPMHLVLVHFSQLRHEHQSRDAQAVQLPLPIGQDGRTGTHMARYYGAQLRIVGCQEACDLSELRWIPGESQDREIRLVDRGVEREICDKRGVTVEENGKTIFERDEERCGRAAVCARRKGVVMGARTNLEGNAFQDKPIADTRSPELILFKSVCDQPASQRCRSNDRCSRLRRDLGRISHVIGVSIWNENEIRPSQIVKGNRSIRIGKPGTRDDDHAFGRSQPIELVAQPFDLDFSLRGRGRLGEPDR